MEPISRRNILAAASGGLLTAATAQPAAPQPQRSGHGGPSRGRSPLTRLRAQQRCHRALAIW